MSGTELVLHIRSLNSMEGTWGQYPPRGRGQWAERPGTGNKGHRLRPPVACAQLAQLAKVLQTHLLYPSPAPPARSPERHLDPQPHRPAHSFAQAPGLKKIRKLHIKTEISVLSLKGQKLGDGTACWKAGQRDSDRRPPAGPVLPAAETLEEHRSGAHVSCLWLRHPPISGSESHLSDMLELLGPEPTWDPLRTLTLQHELCILLQTVPRPLSTDAILQSPE